MTPARARRTDLWSIVEALQRRLERQGLATEVVDAAITRALTDALGGPGTRLAKA
jgi:hypothetical protein